jgi:hypothetical protein
MAADSAAIKADTSASVESLKEKAEAKVKGIQGEIKASEEGPGVLGALIKWVPHAYSYTLTS